MSRFADHTDEELYALAARDEAALVALYRRHARALLGFCARRAGDPDLAADVHAEVFAALVGRVLSGRPAPESVAGWLFGAARNQVADAVRRGQAETRARSKLGIARTALTDEGIERVLEAAGDVRAVAALEALPEVQRAAVRARVVEEASYDEIAHAQDTTAATARQRVLRGLARMRTTLGVGDER